MGSTLRDALESAISAQEAKESTIAEAPSDVVETAAPAESVQPASSEVPIGESAEARADRLRDEKGRFVEGKPEPKVAAKPAAKAAPEATQAVAAAVAAPVVSPAAPKIPKPDSWKKEWQADWDALTPKQQEIAKIREDQYFKGVSTYKQEWEGAKPLLDAIAPFIPDLQRFGQEPAKWISSLGAVHRSLAMGSPQEKMAVVQNILRNNGIQAQLAVQDAQGQWSLLAPQAMPQPQYQPQQAPQQQDVGSTVRQILEEERAKQSLAEFERDAPTKYPHYETVRPDMALLLDAGKAHDFTSAYEMALRLHDDLFAAAQAEKQKADEASRLEAQRKAVAAAKGSAVSVKSATPASSGSAPQKGIRSNLESAWDQHAGGRV